MQLILLNSGFRVSLYHGSWQGGPTHSDLGNSPGSESYRRRSPSDLRAGAGNGGFCLAANGQAFGRKPPQAGRFAVHAFRNESTLRERNDRQAQEEEAGPEERASREPPAQAAGYRQTGHPSFGTLPRLSEQGDAVSGDADAHRR